MKTIVISGARSNIGKTLFAEELLRYFENWSALKVTVKRKTGCARKKSSCRVCDQLRRDFEIIRDKKIIGQKDTDTARLLGAGAQKVLWLRATTTGLKAGFKQALSQLNSAKGVVIEGTSVLKYIKPDLAIYLETKDKNLRPEAMQAKEKADIIINVNR